MTTKTKTILIIEDEKSLNRVYQLIFIKEGYRVLIAENYAEAIELYEKEKPNIIILDLFLPGIGGEEILCKIRQKDSNVPVIICSSNTDADLAAYTIKHGAYDYILKPFDIDKLVVLVKEALLKKNHDSKS